MCGIACDDVIFIYHYIEECWPGVYSFEGSTLPAQISRILCPSPAISPPTIVSCEYASAVRK